MLPAALLLAPLLACNPGKSGGGEDYFGDWACEHEPWDWYSDPVQAVLEADEEGDFDYDPPGALVTGREGSYDFEDGDLEFTSRYLDGYYGVEGRAEGYGTVFDDGDLDLLYRSVFVDVLGEESHTRVRVERSGCSETSKSWAIEAGDDLDATPTEDPFEWQLEIVSDDRVEALSQFSEDGEDWTYSRVWTSDLVTTTSFETSSGAAWGQTVMQDDGTGTGSQTVLGDEVDATYTIDYRLDGSRRIQSLGTYAGTDDQYSSCDYELSYEGYGDGACSFDVEGDTWDCDITITPDSCELDCGGNGTYDC
ncbi:hypothetical protein L6R53_12225 [Myxococcota bacterium]|nr:hypothetical protein [Myxococcota bacterium]